MNLSLIADFPLLSCLVLGPALCALLLGLLPARAARTLAPFAMALALGVAGLVFVQFAPAGERFQALEAVRWIGPLHAWYRLGIDGLSVLFLPSTCLLFIGVAVVAWRSEAAQRRGFWQALLWLQTALLGVFCALDALLFFVFWEMTLPPLYFLLARGGVTANAPGVAGRYVLIMLASGIPVLAAILLVAAGDPRGLDLTQSASLSLPFGLQQAVFLLFLLGFAFKVPLVPVHTWLPQFALTAPGSLLALVLGLKIGAYALIRLAIPLAPAAAQDFHWLLAGLGTVSLLYGAVGLLAQTHLRVGLAYLSMCHVGLAVLGLSAYSAQGVHGAASLLLSFAVASGGACLILECVRQRTGSNDAASLGGLAGNMPRLASAMLVCGLAGVGFPGASSFPGEFLTVLSVLESHTGAGMAALFGLGIAAASFLALYRRAFFGTPQTAAAEAVADALPRERRLLWVIIALAGGIGLYPAPWLDVLRPAAEAWALGLR